MVRLFSIVKIKKLLQPVNTYNSFDVNQYPPQIGDEGTVVDVLQAPELSPAYVVESVNSEAETLWLSIFAEEEIEILWEPETHP